MNHQDAFLVQLPILDALIGSRMMVLNIAAMQGFIFQSHFAFLGSVGIF